MRACIRRFLFYLLLVDPTYLYLDIDSGGIRSYGVRENLQSLLRFKGIQYLYITKKVGRKGKMIVVERGGAEVIFAISIVIY